MATRNKIYYPVSQIITGLYTAGKEWSLTDGTEYIGFYHKYMDGMVMTGPDYNERDSVNLIPYSIFQKTTSEYDVLKPRYNFTSPEMSMPVPTENDYRNGKFTRYMIRKRNSDAYNDIIEIDSRQYKSWKIPNTGIDEDLYEAVALEWKLTGPRIDTSSVYGVEDTNRRIVLLTDVTLPGLKYYLTNYIEHSIYSPVVSIRIKKLFSTILAD